MSEKPKVWDTSEEEDILLGVMKGLELLPIDQETGEVIDFADIRVEGLSAGELDTEIWKNLALD